MNELIQVGHLDGKHEQSNRIYSEEGICPTIMAGERKSCTGGYVAPKILTQQKINENSIIRLGQVSNKGSQSGMVYDPQGLFPTVCACTHGYAIGNILEEKMNQLMFKGGIGDKDWVGDGKVNSRNYPQGNRIYGDEGVACNQTASGGGLGGATGLYMVEQNINNKGDNNMWKNNLEKYNFNMFGNNSELRVFDAFFGIGHCTNL